MAISCPVLPPTGGDGQETPLPINNRESPVPRQLIRRISLPIAVNQHPLQPHLQRGPVWTNPREAPAPAMSPIGATVAGRRVPPARAPAPVGKRVMPKRRAATRVPCHQSVNRRWQPCKHRYFTWSAS